MRRWHVLVEPTVPILLLASVVHVIRHNAVDLAVFAGTALVIVVDSLRPAVHSDGAGRGRRRDVATRSGRLAGRWASVGAVVVFASVVALADRDSAAIRAVLVAAAAASACLVFAPRASRRTVPRRTGPRETGPRRTVPRRTGLGLLPAIDAPAGSPRGWWIWAVIGVSACLWELTSFIFGQLDPTRDSPHPVSETTHPAVSDLVGPLLAGWPGRAVFLLLWAAAGLWLLRHLRASDRSSP